MPEIANLFPCCPILPILALYPMLFAGLLAKCFLHATVCSSGGIAAPSTLAAHRILRIWLGADRLPVVGFGYTQIDGLMRALAPIHRVGNAITFPC